MPTAEILETGASIIPFPYVIARSVVGIEGVHHPERHKIIHELGRQAKKINSIRTRGFGETFDWSNNELSRNANLKEYLEGEYGYEARIEELDRSGLIPAPALKAVGRIMRELSKEKARPVLNHGDMRLKNVLADEAGKIVAVIDWEDATSNIAPQWELSIALHDPGIDGKQQFVEGYGITPKKLAEITPYIRAFNLLNYKDEINRAVTSKDKPAIARLRSRFAGDLDLYSIS